MKKLITNLLLITLFSFNTFFCQAQQRGDTLTLHRNKKGTISFIRFKQNKNRKLTDAKVFIKSVLHAKPEDEFRLIRETTDKWGITNLRFQQYYKGIKVENREYLVHGKNGTIETINGDFVHVNLSSVTPSITEQQALKKAVDFVNAKEYKWQDKNYEKFIKQMTGDRDATYYPKGELVIMKDYLKGGKNMRLAWKFNISSLVPNNEQAIYLDASTGEVIANIPLIADANIPGTAQTMYSGTRAITCDSYSGGYRLEETRNGVSIKTYNSQETENYLNVDFANSNTTWTSGSWTNFPQDQPALDAQWGAEKVIDFWQIFFNRNSLNGNGLGINMYVHFGFGMNNAGWDPTPKVAYFGDGNGTTEYPNTSLDLIGHELGHGINQFTANLSTEPTSEADALNEGFSDIWGTCLEYWVEPEDSIWLHGRDIVNTNLYTCIRDLENPTDARTAEIGPHAQTYGDNWWNNNREGHYRSTVLSHWFYLLSIGQNSVNDLGTHYWVNGIGINEAQQIAFKGETSLFSSATFADARNAMIDAAIDLYGASSCE